MTTPQGFTCPVCLYTSWHPKDAAAGYCGYCHDFTGSPYPCGCPRTAAPTCISYTCPELGGPPTIRRGGLAFPPEQGEENLP